jgi:glycerophosphoryl diester phosphodiesterase
VEFVNYKEFVKNLTETESPTSADKVVVSNPTNGPRSMPGSAKDRTTTLTTFREGDAIPVDGADLAKMPFAFLAKEIAGTANVSCYATGNRLPNVDSATKTIDLGGSFLLRTKNHHAFITDNSIPLIDTTITSRLQVLVYNFATSTFSLKIYTADNLTKDECIVGMTCCDNNADFNFVRAWFPFEFTVDGKSPDNFVNENTQRIIDVAKHEGTYFGYTRNFIPNIDTENNTIDFGGDFLIRSKNNRAVISSRSVSICDTSITSSLQILVYNFTSGTFELRLFTNSTIPDDSVIVGILRFTDNVNFKLNKAWFPFEFSVDGKSDNKFILENETWCRTLYATEADADEIKNGWVATNTGAFQSNANLRCAVFQNKGYSKVNVCTGASDANSEVVAFYSEGFEKCYLKEASRQATAGKDIEYSVNVPKEAKYIAVSYRLQSTYTTKFYLRLIKGYQTYTDVNTAGFYLQTKTLSEIPLGWRTTYTPNRIFSQSIKVYPNMQFSAKLVENSPYFFSLHIRDANSQIYDSGWKTELTKTLPSNAVTIDLWWRKADNTDFVAGDENDVNDEFDYMTLTTYDRGGVPAAMQYVDDTKDEIYNVLAPKKVRNVAHQGYSITSRFYGDSRLSSYTTLAKNGFDYGECDVQWSSDNVPVCCHDSSFVDQTTSDTIVIADHTAAELKTYNYYGETIATFEEILVECKKQGVGLYIDKTGDFLINHDDRKAIMFGLVTKYEMEDDVVFLVSVQAQVDALLAWYDKVSIGILVNSTISSTEISLANGAYNGKNYVFIDAAKTNNTTSDVATAKESLLVGVKIELWTIDDVTQYKSYFPYVSGITSNKLSEKIIKELPV